MANIEEDFWESTRHCKLVSKLKKSADEIHSSLDGKKCDLLHMAIGICTEASELLDAVKKHVFYEKPLDEDNVIEELGDLEFYMEGIRQTLSIDRAEILEDNFNKLSKRYNEMRFTNKAAVIRADKIVEDGA
jgi:NTP pyrophosphatase (non-canonical NTP hydrolase)